MKHLPRFMAAYALLGALAALIAFASVKVLLTSPASHDQVKAVQKILDPGRQAIEQSACAYVTQAAAQQGEILTSCHISKSKGALRQKANQALVVIDARSNTTDYVVVVHLQKAGWTPDGLQIAGAVQKTR